MKTAAKILTLALCGLTAGNALGATLHVPGDHAQINAAVQACAPGDTVLVAAGTWSDCTHPCQGPESTTACVIMQPGVTVRGAGPTQTVIDAGGVGRGFYIDGADGCRIENLRVTDAFAEAYGAAFLLRNQVSVPVEITDVDVFANGDGGIICYPAALLNMKRVNMVDNTSKQGGGLAVENASVVHVSQCRFEGNDAPTAAGAYISESTAVFELCTFTLNTVTSSSGNGGGLLATGSSVEITHSDFVSNTTPGYGGGIALITCSGSIFDSLIHANACTGDFSQGGGIHMNDSSVDLSYCIVAENTMTGASAGGGGLDLRFGSSPTIENCSIVGNSCGASGSGGGIQARWGSNAEVTRCIIASSTVGAAMYASGATPVVTCSDLWGNAGGDLIAGTDNGGNFSENPAFCGPVNSAWNLSASSPCAPGNHPAGLCSDSLVGALEANCSPSATPQLTQALVSGLGNAPNPFNPQTEIFFKLAQPGEATLRVFDLAGHCLETRQLGKLNAGRHEVLWNGRDNRGKPLPSGVYFYQVEALGLQLTERMSLIR